MLSVISSARIPLASRYLSNFLSAGSAEGADAGTNALAANGEIAVRFVEAVRDRDY